MDQTRTDQCEQDRTELNENKPAWSRASLTRPMQSKVNTQDLAKQNRATRSDLTRVYQDDQTDTVRTPPDQHGQKQSDRRDQDRTVKPDLIKTETKQAKPNRVAAPNILRKATAFDTSIMLLDQSSASEANSTDKRKPNQAVGEQTNQKDHSRPV